MAVDRNKRKQGESKSRSKDARYTKNYEGILNNLKYLFRIA